MIYILIGVFALYSVYKAFLSILQIKFISQNATKKAVVLSQEDYEKAAIIAIKNEKFSLASNIFSFILLVFWSLCGANLLQNLFNDGLFGNTIFCVAFLVINSLFHIPFEIYERFVKDK
nr:M48 family peptidase [Campylobacter sp.]